MAATTALPATPTLRLDQIKIKTNIRKSFDEDSIIELSSSIRENGVIQPILVRPVQGGYELVCGERRYRASKLVQAAFKDRNTIPVHIRELTDHEALEAQITENLQRKDVHPMDEAYAFKTMLESGKSVEEIANRVAKKESFVRQRLKLNSLIDCWQKIFYNNCLSITDALKLAVFPERQQVEMWESEDMDERKEGSTRVVELNDWRLNKFNGMLATASFDITDATIDKKMGPCTTCQFNSSVSKLFPDDEQKAICSNISCFSNKAELAFNIELAIAKDDPTIAIVRGCDGEDKLIIKLLKEGHQVLKEYNDYREVPGNLGYPEWDEFKENWLDEFDGTEQEMQDDYKKELAEYEKIKADYEKKVASGKYLKAFCVGGNDKGKYIYIELYKKGADKKTKDQVAFGTATVSIADIDSEIDRIKDREKRAKELDAEKVHKRIIEDLQKNNFLKTLNLPSGITDNILIRFLLCEQLNHYNDIGKRVKKIVKIGDSYGGNPGNKWKLMEAITNDELALIARNVIMQKYGAEFPTQNGGYALRQMAESFGNIPINAYEQEQMEKSEKRQANVAKRIADLQEQKKELKKSEKPASGTIRTQKKPTNPQT